MRMHIVALPTGKLLLALAVAAARLVKFISNITHKAAASVPQENHSRARLHGALILRTPAWRSIYSPGCTARHYFVLKNVNLPN